MATPTYVREDQFNIQVSIVGVTFPFTTSWQSMEGGDVEANAVKTHPGGMLGEIALGGPASRGDCTVARLYEEDLDAFIPTLEGLCGNARMSVSWAALDGDGNPAGGMQHVLTGYLKTVDIPTYDANASAAALLKLVMSCDQFQQGAAR